MPSVCSPSTQNVLPSCTDGTVNSTNKSSVCCCQPVSSHTSHFTLLPQVTPPCFLFLTEAWNELILLCLSGPERQRIRGRGFGDYGSRYRGENAGGRWETHLSLETQTAGSPVLVMSWDALWFITTNWWILREGSSHRPKAWTNISAVKKETLKKGNSEEEEKHNTDELIW